MLAAAVSATALIPGIYGVSQPVRQTGKNIHFIYYVVALVKETCLIGGGNADADPLSTAHRIALQVKTNKN